MSETVERGVPYYCPYCAGEDLRPYVPVDGPEVRGGWECRECTRVFSLTLIGLVVSR